MKESQRKAFIFLYPEIDIIDYEIKRGTNLFFCSGLKVKLSEHPDGKTPDSIVSDYKKIAEERFRQLYKEKLNACIDLRYRQQGFTVYYAIFDRSKVSDVLEIKPEDRVIHVGMDAATHRTKGPNGKYPYPDQNYIINQMMPLGILRIGGFHVWDCIQKLARRAYRRGIDTLVDEDLTEFFAYNSQQPEFKLDKFPSLNPKKGSEGMYELFKLARKGKPWMWQKY